MLPYFQGSSLDARDRRLRLPQPPATPGWYRFGIKGRIATVKGEADAPPMDGLPKVRGWFLQGRLVRDGANSEVLQFLPGDQPSRFAPITARRWPSGDLIFEQLEFETEVEAAVREALADGKPLETVKGVPAPLRAAYAWALLEQAERRTGIRWMPYELRGHLREIAEKGPAEADAALRRLEAEREQAREEMAELERRRAQAIAQEEVRRIREARIAELAKRREAAEDRARDALEGAGARLDDARVLGNGELEVRFRFMNHAFVSLVDPVTLQVIDSGICLGHPPSDKLVTLDSLPSVIKEAIETDALVYLRWP